MIPPKSLVQPLSLHATGGSLNPASTRLIRSILSSSLCLRRTRRHFSWGARHKIAGNTQGKTVADKIKRAMLGRAGYRYPYLERQIFLRRCLPAAGWRSASHLRNPQIWAKCSQDAENDRSKSEMEEEDWYARWERQKKEQYEAFMKKIDQDPFMALFGRSNRWLGWMSEKETPPEVSNVSKGQTKVQKPTSSQPIKEAVSQSEERRPEQRKEYFAKAKTGDTNVKATVVSQTEDLEYDIDPITLRKVARVEDETLKKKVGQSTNAEKGHKISVKTFMPSNTREKALSGNKRAAIDNDRISTEKKDWLSAQGFGSAKSTSMQHPTNTGQSRKVTPKIESALDRHVQQKSSRINEHVRSLRYEGTENKSEDIDLLRASDVRASSGIRGRKPREDSQVKLARQQEMETNYETRPAELEQRLQREISETEAKSDSESSKSLNHLDAQYMNKVSDAARLNPPPQSEPSDANALVGATGKLNLYANERANQLKAKIMPLKARIDLMKAEYDTLRQRWLKETKRVRLAEARKIHDEEVRAQKSAMEALEARQSHRTSQSPQTVSVEDIPRGEGDVAANVHEFTSRARWYKRKAPHAKDEMDAKFQRLAKDSALVRDIREIYEECYGVIDAEHRQPSSSDTEASPAVSDRHELLKEDPSQILLKGAGSSYNAAPIAPGNAEVQETQAFIQELEAELRSVDELIQAQIQQTYTDTATGMLIKSSAYRQHMTNILKTASRLTHGTAAMRKDLIDTAISAAGISWQANLALFNRHIAMLNLRGRSEGNAVLSKTTATEEQEPLLAASNPTSYRILAYDMSAQRLISAKTTSLRPFENEKSLKPLEALTLLDNPGKFLPQLMSLHHKGYDIVAGASNILVLKKVRHPHPPTPPDESRLVEHFTKPYLANPIDGTISSAGNYASPTGFVNHDSVLTPEELERLVLEQRKQQQEALQSASSAKAAKDSPTSFSIPPTSTQDSNLLPEDKVRRKETVFSGRSHGRWHEHHGGKRSGRKKDRRAARRRRTLRRMVLTGTLTAACCYAAGVAIEYFRL